MAILSINLPHKVDTFTYTTNTDMEQNDTPANVPVPLVRPETLEENIARQLAEKGKTRIQDIVGQWPGDETMEELLQQLAD